MCQLTLDIVECKGPWSSNSDDLHHCPLCLRSVCGCTPDVYLLPPNLYALNSWKRCIGHKAEPCNLPTHVGESPDSWNVIELLFECTCLICVGCRGLMSKEQRENGAASVVPSQRVREPPYSVHGPPQLAHNPPLQPLDRPHRTLYHHAQSEHKALPPALPPLVHAPPALLSSYLPRVDPEAFSNFGVLIPPKPKEQGYYYSPVPPCTKCQESDVTKSRLG